MREGNTVAVTAADFVSLHVPLRPATRGLIGGSQLARMKPTGFLINTARGGVVDQAALANALRHGPIAGAAVDRVRPEPPAPDNPLFTPAGTHVAGLAEPAMMDLSQATAGQVSRALRDERPAHLLNPTAWPPRRPLPRWE